jgi:hypothetical protein
MIIKTNILPPSRICDMRDFLSMMFRPFGLLVPKGFLSYVSFQSVDYQRT